MLDLRWAFGGSDLAPPAFEEAAGDEGAELVESDRGLTVWRVLTTQMGLEMMDVMLPATAPASIDSSVVRLADAR